MALNKKGNQVNDVYDRKIKFDEWGNASEIIEYGKDNQVLSRKVIVFYPEGVYRNVEGGVFEKECCMYDKDDNLEWKDEYSYKKSDDDNYYITIIKHTDNKTGEVTVTYSDD